MNSIRRHLTYANVVATLALLFAMSGGALAAQHYLINSTHEINPKVLKKLKGRTGRTGATGRQGLAGTPGPKGETGPKGEAGASAPSTLPSGQSESGYYSLSESYIKEGSSADLGVSFPTRLAAPLPEGQVIYLPPGNTNAHCTGPGHADPGFLCIYSHVAGGVVLENVVDNEPPGKAGSGVFGFEMSWELSGTTGSGAEDRGIWTVTAA
jgi:hypothetical protein